MKELNKTIQDLKVEAETIKKSQSETYLEIENLGKNSGVINASLNNRIHAEDTIENIDSTVNGQRKCKMHKACNQNIQEIQYTMRRLYGL